MNAKKLLFGLMAVSFLALTVVSTTVIDEDVLSDKTEIRKGDKGKH